MRCYYEVLGVSQKATDEELKKSYRKMALQWHPDKNPDNLQEAKLQFQLIQSAYDTLSDPQERAFYDRNRESILKGKASGEDRKPETMDLFAYFSTSCYSGFNDSEKGFYTVYRKIFERIAAKDMEYMDDDEEDFSIPNFGRSDADLEDVSQFYGYWMSYCTQMSFAWADQYDVREAKSMGRWVEKKIEGENKKCRVKMKKEFNEEVRTLVAFAQKRDKRWKERKRQLEAKVAENRKKQESEQKRQREERLKLIEESQEKEKANMSAYEEQLREMEARFADEWGLSDSESEYSEEDEYLEDLEEEGDGELETEEGAEEEEIVYDDLFCVACNKSFKTDKAMESHDRSKKHRESVSRLKAKMTAENDLFEDAEDQEKYKFEQDETDGSPDNSPKKKKQGEKADTKEIDEDDSEKENDAESEKENEPEKDDSLFRLYCAPCNKSFKTENAMEAHERAKKHRDIVSRLKAAETKENQKNDTEQVKSKASKKKKNKNSDDSDDEKSLNEVNVDNTIHEDSNTEEDDAQPTLKGKKAKDARKKARETTSSQVANGTEEKASSCSVCKKEFASRTKMFSHIKATGHAALKGEPSMAATGKKGKKGKK